MSFLFCTASTLSDAQSADLVNELVRESNRCSYGLWFVLALDPMKAYDQHQDSIKISPACHTSPAICQNFPLSPVDLQNNSFRGYTLEQLKEVCRDLQVKQGKRDGPWLPDHFIVLDDRSARDKSALIVKHSWAPPDEPLEESFQPWTYTRTIFRHVGFIATLYEVAGGSGWDEMEDGRGKYTDEHGIVQIPEWDRDPSTFPDLPEELWAPWGDERR
ncbi:hypothetical protein EJ06DRAFT_533979 [Trichodelitschia bisporula]|uniref:Uncharacterized protein n=1 Tax=Trichodelitschia bisporula TaxID=703511 RepID=A0A6G1HKW9_9PEZI|nr:hypothetical protein EJ06DRAFT_533979 [Trichodelitschia bisporula]